MPAGGEGGWSAVRSALREGGVIRERKEEVSSVSFVYEGAWAACNDGGCEVVAAEVLYLEVLAAGPELCFTVIVCAQACQRGDTRLADGGGLRLIRDSKHGGNYLSLFTYSRSTLFHIFHYYLDVSIGIYEQCTPLD